MLIFFSFGEYDLGTSVALGIGSILFAIRVRWDLRRRFWFWCIIVLVLLLHIPLILHARWPHGWVPGIALLPTVLADCLIILGIVRFVEKYVVRASSSED